MEGRSMMVKIAVIGRIEFDEGIELQVIRQPDGSWLPDIAFINDNGMISPVPASYDPPIDAIAGLNLLVRRLANDVVNSN